MLRRFRFFWLMLSGSLLGSCTPQESSTEAPPPPALGAVAAGSAPAPPAVRPDADSTDLSAYQLRGGSSLDTSVVIQGKRYQLQLSATTDSVHMLTFTSTGLTGEAFAADENFEENQRVHGPDGRYQITLTQAGGRRVFRRELKKADFYRVAAPDMVVVSEPQPPRFLGYFPELGGLAFWQQIGIPDSDVGGYVFLLLDLQGEVRQLHFGNQFGAGRTDCVPQPAPNGQALLTCAQLLRVRQPPLLLQKPQAEVVLARFLSDSTLLTIYAYGEYQPVRSKDGSESVSLVVPPHLRTAPNAFVQNLRGQVRASFRYTGYSDMLGYAVPRHYAWQNQTYYLLDEERGLRLINKQDVTLTQEVPFGRMTKFRRPQRPEEVHFRLETETARFDFYADKTNPARLRYRRLKEAD